MTGWVGSLLHCSGEAVAPGENPVPEMFTTSPAARPVQIGSKGLELSQLAPAAVVERLRVVPGVLVVEAHKTEVVSIAPPIRTETAPPTASTEDSFKPRTAPPLGGSSPKAISHLRSPPNL